MSFRTTLVLFVVFALIVGGYLGYNEWKKSNTGTTPKLVEVDPLAIQRLEVVQGDKKVVYQKSFLKIWEMQEPRYNVVDSRVIETATVLLSGLQAPDLKNSSANVGEYGLNPPQFTVKITLANNTVYTLLFGNKSPDGRTYYMQKEGDPKVYLMVAQLGDPVLDLFRSPPVTPTPTPTRTETPWPAHIPTETVTPTWTPWPTLTPTPYREPTVTMTPTSTPAPRTPQPLVAGTSTPMPPTTPTAGRTPGP
jgi:hypothetical protein